MTSRHGQSALQICQSFILNSFIKKDRKNVFLNPITDDLAPNYSKIIKRPMCFSVIRENIQNKEYATMFNFLLDLELVFKNAMIYNHPLTIYHEMAKTYLEEAYEKYSETKIQNTLIIHVSDSLKLQKKDYGFDGSLETINLFRQLDERTELKKYARLIIPEKPVKVNPKPVSTPKLEPKPVKNNINNGGVTNQNTVEETKTNKVALGNKSCQFNFVHPNSIFGMHNHNRKLHDQKCVKRIKQRSIKLDTGYVVKYLNKSQGLLLGPTYESLNGPVSTAEATDIRYYADNLVLLHKKISKLDELNIDHNEVSCSILANVLKRSVDELKNTKAPQKQISNETNIVNNPEPVSKNCAKSANIQNNNQEYLNSITEDLIDMNGLTKEQYFMNPQKFVPFMSQDQTALSNRIRLKIQKIVQTGQPKNFVNIDDVKNLYM